LLGSQALLSLECLSVVYQLVEVVDKFLLLVLVLNVKNWAYQAADRLLSYRDTWILCLGHRWIDDVLVKLKKVAEQVKKAGLVDLSLVLRTDQLAKLVYQF